MTVISRSPILPKSQMPLRQRTAPTQNSAKPSSMADLRSCAHPRRPGAPPAPGSFVSVAGGDVLAGGNTHLRSGAVRPDVEVEDLGWDRDGAARIRDVDDSADTPFNGGGAED